MYKTYLNNVHLLDSVTKNPFPKEDYTKERKYLKTLRKEGYNFVSAFGPVQKCRGYNRIKKYILFHVYPNYSPNQNSHTHNILQFRTFPGNVDGWVMNNWKRRLMLLTGLVKELAYYSKPELPWTPCLMLGGSDATVDTLYWFNDEVTKDIKAYTKTLLPEIQEYITQLTGRKFDVYFDEERNHYYLFLVD